MKQIKNLEGGYYSTYAFVQRNNLENIAEEVLGKDWEAEDDVAQIQSIIDYMSIGEYSVTCSEYDTREDDIIVTKIEDNYYKSVEYARQLLKDNGYYVENLWHIDDVKSKKECSDDEAYDILDNALQNEATYEQIWMGIDYAIDSQQK